MEEEGWLWKIPLTKNKVVVDWALCSEEDYEALSRHKWGIDNNNYAKISNNPVENQTLMHRYIKHVLEMLPVKRNYVVDHIDGNRLNNRRENLRIVTLKQNYQNKSKPKTVKSTSKYIGVSFKPKWKKYLSFLSANGKYMSLGYYKTEEEAAKVRDVFLLHQSNTDTESFYHKLNFPERKEELKLETPYVLKPKKQAGKFFHVWKKNKQFLAQVSFKGKILLKLSSYDEMAAAKAVDACIVENGLNRPLNFPLEYPNYIPILPIKTEYTDVDENTIRVHLNSKPDTVALLDRIDYDIVKNYKLLQSREGHIRLCLSPIVYLHRHLLGLTDPSMIVDHIDGNPANNKRSNLRIVTAHQNGQNKNRTKTATSLFYGVSAYKNKFTASLSNQTFSYHKSHKTEMHAARDRDLVILKLFPDSFYRLNFEWTPFQIKVWAGIVKNKYYKENATK